MMSKFVQRLYIARFSARPPRRNIEKTKEPFYVINLDLSVRLCDLVEQYSYSLVDPPQFTRQIG